VAEPTQPEQQADGREIERVVSKRLSGDKPKRKVLHEVGQHEHRDRRGDPGLVVPELRSATFAECAAHHEAIREALATNHLSTVHQRLRDEHGFTASESSLRRYVAVALAGEARADRVTVLKDDPPPGEEAEVDYGRLGMWFDPEGGLRRALWAFVIVLSASRHLFVRPTLVMDQTEWVAAWIGSAASKPSTSWMTTARWSPKPQRQRARRRTGTWTDVVEASQAPPPT
jgi:hypothetical protein